MSTFPRHDSPRRERLGPEDYESIERASLGLHTQGWRKAFGLNEMLEAYEQLVTKVEEGDDEMVDEYTNDLSCRAACFSLGIPCQGLGSHSWGTGRTPGPLRSLGPPSTPTLSVRPGTPPAPPGGIASP